jgi:hypothetical protein
VNYVNPNLVELLEDKRFKDVVALVEANSFEKHVLWDRHHEELRWEEDPNGLFINLGSIDDMPVTLNIFFAKLNGYRVLFYDMPSMVTDHRKVDNFFIRLFGHMDGGYRSKDASRRIICTDAMNFWNVVHYINFKLREHQPA